MSVRVKHIAVAAFILVFAAGLGMLRSCQKREDSRRLCSSLDVIIPGTLEFVTQDDVRGMMDRGYGPYIGVLLDSLDLGRIEHLMESKGVVKDCEAWTTRDGVLHISISQRTPVLMFKRGEEGFYLDRDACVMPLHSSYTADVPVIEGAIPDLSGGKNTDWSMGVLELMDWIAASKTWKEKIEKVSVNKDGDIELRVTDGKERFIFGAPGQTGSKFSRMEKYYSHIVPSKGEGYYKSVNLKYNKQIICRKDI